MKSIKVQLVSPQVFKAVEYELEDGIIVKPSHLSVCNADIRYYNGERPPEVLKKKLPLSLIHEAAGLVVKSNNPEFKEGDRVCIVPISRNNSLLDKEYNYDYPGSAFMSSSKDGCMQTYLSLESENLVKFNSIKPEYASLVEVASIATQAIRRLDTFYNREIKKIAVHGTGSVGFWLSLMLKATKPDAEVTVIGISQKQLDSFDFVDNTVLSQDLDLTQSDYDLVVEAVGGYGSESVLHKAIKQLKPVGCILLMGVSEQNLHLNTREWMEKGVIILTSHRSTKEDFEKAIDLMENNDCVNKHLHKGVSIIRTVKTIDDIHEAISTSKIYQFKTVMDWQFEETLSKD